MFRGKGQLYSWVTRYFKGSPADRESDSALAELLSGSTLADQSRGMLFVLGLLVLVFSADYAPVNLELYKLLTNLGAGSF